jgi:tRNA-Thr(GGU) m(6)t(6)A37 methyltransferase TsaA
MTQDGDATRPGEITLPFDPAVAAGDAHIGFIGRIRTPWATRREAPHNPREARERGRPATIEVDAPFRAGLTGLEGFSHIIVLYWMHQTRRDLLVQTPPHLKQPRGTFALRSPSRPNPIALSVVKILGIDPDAGRIEIDAIDCVDGTPLVDIKPYLPRVDAFPDAIVP